jgi:hypothetical protein
MGACDYVLWKTQFPQTKYSSILRFLPPARYPLWRERRPLRKLLAKLSAAIAPLTTASVSPLVEPISKWIAAVADTVSRATTLGSAQACNWNWV